MTVTSDSEFHPCFDYRTDNPNNPDSENGRKLAIQYRSGILQRSPVYDQPINLTELLLGSVDVGIEHV